MREPADDTARSPARNHATATASHATKTPLPPDYPRVEFVDASLQADPDGREERDTRRDLQGEASRSPRGFREHHSGKRPCDDGSLGLQHGGDDEHEHAGRQDQKDVLEQRCERAARTKSPQDGQVEERQSDEREGERDPMIAGERDPEVIQREDLGQRDRDRIDDARLSSQPQPPNERVQREQARDARGSGDRDRLTIRREEPPVPAGVVDRGQDQTERRHLRPVPHQPHGASGKREKREEREEALGLILSGGDQPRTGVRAEEAQNREDLAATQDGERHGEGREPGHHAERRQLTAVVVELEREVRREEQRPDADRADRLREQVVEAAHAQLGEG